MSDPLDLVTLPVAKQALLDAGLTAPADLAGLVTGVSAAMQSYASRTFGSASYTTTRNGDGGCAMSLPNYPITAVASVSVDGVSLPAATTPTGAGFVFSDTQVFLRGHRFCRGIQNVTIAYTAGFATVPADIQRACCEGVSAVVAAFEYGDPRAVNVKAGGSGIELGSIAELAKLCLTPNVTMILDQVKRVVPC